jgi:energy-coupling factor transporter ATP-binding protein EcfA2
LAGFQKAKREQIAVKVLLGGASGSGKTYSALRLAKGIAKKAGGKIAAIDTENGRIRYYADEFDFDDMRLAVPFEPEKYIEAIEEAVGAGYTVLIIDSITHEWDYCLEIHSKMPGNSYTNWAKITPRHDAMMEKILQSPIHVIATVRGKDEYVLEDKDGKKVPQKVGLGYKQRDNTEYNYTVTFNIDQKTHVADVMKDNTHLFEGRYEMLTEKDGERIWSWANEGDEAEPLPPKGQSATKKIKPEAEELSEVKSAVIAACKEKGGSNNKNLMEIVKKYEPSGNTNKIKDVNILKELLAEVEGLENE